VAGAAKARTGKRHGNMAAEPCTHAVRQPRLHVGFVDHDRCSAPAGCQVHGSAYVAAHTHQDIGLGVIQDSFCLLDSSPQAPRKLQEIKGRFSWQRDPVNSGELVPGRRDKPGFQARRRADSQDGSFRTLFLDCVRDGQQRTDMAGRTTACKHDGQRLGRVGGI